jgi:hypothetical protein
VPLLLAPTHAAVATELATASLAAKDALLTLPVEGSVAAGGAARGILCGQDKAATASGGFRLVAGCCHLRAVLAGARRAGVRCWPTAVAGPTLSDGMVELTDEMVG